MRIAKIIGTVTLSEAHPSLKGGTFKLAIPLTLDDLQDRTEPAADELVLYDELGAGMGSLVALSEGAEAAQPFRPEIKPIDAYNAALLDQINIRE